MSATLTQDPISRKSLLKLHKILQTLGINRDELAPPVKKLFQAEGRKMYLPDFDDALRVLRMIVLQKASRELRDVITELDMSGGLRFAMARRVVARFMSGPMEVRKNRAAWNQLNKLISRGEIKASVGATAMLQAFNLGSSRVQAAHFDQLQKDLGRTRSPEAKALVTYLQQLQMESYRNYG